MFTYSVRATHPVHISAKSHPVKQMSCRSSCKVQVTSRNSITTFDMNKELQGVCFRIRCISSLSVWRPNAHLTFKLCCFENLSQDKATTEALCYRMVKEKKNYRKPTLLSELSFLHDVQKEPRDLRKSQFSCSRL